MITLGSFLKYLFKTNTTSLWKSDRPTYKTNVSSKLFFEFVSKRSMQDAFSGFLKEVDVSERLSRLYITEIMH